MKKMKKIGIMGGTFNPIHNGHLCMAQAAYEQYHLDQVLFMPSQNPPHKEKKEIVRGEHRTRMIKLAIDGKEHFVFSDLELKRSGTTYTCDTVRQLKKEHPHWELYFILGSDSLVHFDSWYHPQEILKYATILAVGRDSLRGDSLSEICRKKSSELNGNFLPVSMEPLSIASHQIRKKIKTGSSLAGICPDQVQTYIALHGLYGAERMTLHGMDEKKSVILDCLRATLRPKRFLHTLGVMETAATLGFIHLSSENDRKRVELAGALHDCAKYYTGSEMIELCDRADISLSDAERQNTALIHGKLGAYLAQKRYGVNDPEIRSAIACHTTGKPAMTTIEKIVYIADYIEPNRCFDSGEYSLDEIRKTAYQDLDRALCMILTCTVNHLKTSGCTMDLRTMDTYHYYMGK